MASFRMTTRRWMVFVAILVLVLALIVNYPVLGFLALAMAVVTAPQTIVVAMLMHQSRRD